MYDKLIDSILTVSVTVVTMVLIMVKIQRKGAEATDAVRATSPPEREKNILYIIVLI